MKVKIRVGKLGQMPRKQTPQSVGFDIHSAEDYILAPSEIKLISTEVFIEMPIGIEAQIRGRSGLAAKGICLPNSPGTIDPDYRGEVKIILLNLSKENFIIKKGDRIAQMIFAKYESPDLVLHEELSSTDRGHGGFGSTGIN